MRHHDRADVLVVGAGPAGSWAARCLASAGIRVRLFDHSHPREKPCGGGVTGRALALVGGAVKRSSLSAVSIEQGVFEDPRTAPAYITLDRHRTADASLVVVDRKSFDGALLEAAREAGAEHHAERVTDVALQRGRAIVQTARGRYEAEWLIGADGANSLVRRRLLGPFRRDQLSISRGVFVHGRSDRAILVRFVAEPPGYIWSFPRPDHLAVGICAQASETVAPDQRRLFERWLTESGLAEGGRLEPYAWPIPSLGPADLWQERPAGEGYMLAGDAAGLVDPITREGIYFALLSGARAADAIAASSRLDVPRRYTEALRAHVYPELARAALLKRGFFRGTFTRLLVDALRHSAAVRAVMIDLVAGVQSYRTLKLRLLGTLEWRLAWQLLRLERQRKSFGH